VSILITGGAGAIGSNTARGLMARGEKVVIFDRFEPREDNRILGDFTDMFEVETGNIADLATLLNVASRHKVEGIIHCAAMLPPHDNDLHPLDAINTNIVGTANVLEIARSLQLTRVLVASAAGVMGRPSDLETPRREEDVSLPLGGIYPLCKLTCEQLVYSYRQLYKLRATAFRPRNVYGPGANPRIQPLFESFFAALAGEDVVQEAGGDSIFDYTYVKDICGGIVDLYFFTGEDHYVYNLSRGRSTTMSEVFVGLRKVFPNQRIEVGPGPWRGVVEGGKEFELTVHPAVMPPQDVSRATRDFGYKPVWDIEEGLADWARWYKTGDYDA
jgi:nucleoside-diphosphate-sugar epimerase